MLFAVPCFCLVTLAVALPAGDNGAACEPAPQCSSYTLINTRGTAEPQGESLGFTAMNEKIRANRPGGKTYNVVYPADWDQNSTAATEDIFNKVQVALAENAEECFILEGYSQGAVATVNVLGRLTGAAFDAVKGVFLIGNAVHKAGLACNVDMTGGNSTYDVDGLFLSSGLGEAIPANWIPKTLDVCNFADGICDTTNGLGITAEHLAYITDEGVHNMGAEFVLQRL